MLKPLSIIPLACLLLYGCGKTSKKPLQASDNIKITVFYGDNQTAAVGYPVSDSIIIKVTANNIPASNFAVQFTGSGCNEDLTTTLNTKADGTVKYLWLMAANQGLQTLKVVALTSSKRVDSVLIHANATATTGLPLPLRSACTPNPGGEPQKIFQLTTGRLIASFPGKTSLRYSDDNGASWNPITSFGANHTGTLITVSSQDEIFAITNGDGLFYSKDAGNSWQAITPPTFNKNDPIFDITFTEVGRLVFTGGSNDIYISPDKGKTWTNSGNGLNTATQYRCPTELKNGDIYILGWTGILYKSSDGGISWQPKNVRSSEQVTSICADKNGWFYKASTLFNPTGDVVFISKDNGVTFDSFANLATPGGQPFITSLSLQPDGYLYFSELGYSIGRVHDSTVIAGAYALTSTDYPAYIVTKNETLVFPKDGSIVHY